MLDILFCYNTGTKVVFDNLHNYTVVTLFAQYSNSSRPIHTQVTFPTFTSSLCN